MTPERFSTRDIRSCVQRWIELCEETSTIRVVVVVSVRPSLLLS